jgi:hypothetical protein
MLVLARRASCRDFQAVGGADAGEQHLVAEGHEGLQALFHGKAAARVQQVRLVHHQQGFGADDLGGGQVAVQEFLAEGRAGGHHDDDTVQVGGHGAGLVGAVGAQQHGVARQQFGDHAFLAARGRPVHPVAADGARHVAARGAAMQFAGLVLDQRGAAVIDDHQPGLLRGRILGSGLVAVCAGGGELPCVRARCSAGSGAWVSRRRVAAGRRAGRRR